MCKYQKNIKETEPARYEEVRKRNKINFMKSIATSAAHKRRNEKKPLNYQNQVG